MSKFTNAIARNLDGLHIATGSAASCPECWEIDMAGYESGDEGGFSWSECDSCGTTLGGDRHTAHGWPADNGRWKRLAEDPPALFHLSICTDCLLFHANGDEPESWEPRP